MNKLEDRQKIKLEGIQILRMLSCLWIVLIHCCKIRNNILKILLQKKGFHVPNFLIISFYFFYDKLYLRNIKKIKIRFERLLIPYIIIPIIIFILNNFFFVINGKSLYGKLTFFDLIKQLIFGARFHCNFWFQFYAIFLSTFFIIIALIFKNNFLFILQLILIICYALQYSALVFNYFITFKERAYQLMGVIVEAIPFAVTGLTLASYNSINEIKEKKKIIFINIIVLFFIIKYDIFKTSRGIIYPGIDLNVGGICLFICFSFITFKKKSRFLFIINHITNYTGGIYYYHILVMYILKNKISFIGNKNMLGGFIIYITCYFICFIGIRIVGKTKLKNLFY